MTVRPLRWILSLQAILVTFVPFIFIAVSLFILLLPQLKADIESRQQELAEAIETQIESYLASALDDVKAISLLPLDRTINAQGVQRVLDAQIDASKSLNLIYVTELNGLVSTVGIGFSHDEAMHRNLKDINLKDTKLFKEALDNKQPVWSDTFLSIVGSGMAVAVAVPTGQEVVIGEIDLARSPSDLRMRL